ncbi:hypothetical protein BGZ70_006243 [Mortierella alpina]|uniref:Chromo domain-containing protein n=1 Tax=Mortierella alpina TaxID=64518 RepID=A0A9P6INC9_MORAP|nr:hypothetical protein BGZ70_006243 [Mortierella alpina]
MPPRRPYYDEEFEVAQVREHRRLPDGAIQYLVQWTGYPTFASTWQSEADLANAPERLQAYKEAAGLAVPRAGSVAQEVAEVVVEEEVEDDDDDNEIEEEIEDQEEEQEQEMEVEEEVMDEDEGEDEEAGGRSCLLQ